MGAREDQETTVGWTWARRVAEVALLGVILGFLENIWWVGELAASLRPYFALALLVSGFVAGWQGRWGWGWACGSGILALGLGSLRTGQGLATVSGEEVGNRVTVYCHNIRVGNRKAGEVLGGVRGQSPDIAVFLEVDAWWASELEVLEGEYPYHLVEASEGAFGMALYSRIPLEEAVIRDFSGYELPSLKAQFPVGEEMVTLVGTHPPPPVDAFAFRVRNWHLAELARELRLSEEPVIVVGDLNCTPWSAAFRRLLRESGLRNAGPGWRQTWSPLRVPLVGLPLDYQLATGEWKVVRRVTGDFLGSDHRWTLVEYHWSGRRR